ncbi:hypothetical protein PDIDSM_5268 [Penicillium digitatum]|nr:hypothetical protein PDIDSM_5268 [Penicillium digitatum]
MVTPQVAIQTSMKKHPVNSANDTFPDEGLQAWCIVAGSFGLSMGFSANANVVLAVPKVVSTVGRPMTGGVANRFGRINTQSGLIALDAFAGFVIWLLFDNSLIELDMFSVIFGLASRSFLGLAPAYIRQICRASEIDGRIGLIYTIASFTTLICVPTGGGMLDKVGKRAMMMGLFEAPLDMASKDFKLVKMLKEKSG